MSDLQETVTEILLALSRLSDNQLDESISKQLPGLVGQPPEHQITEIKRLLDDCVYGSLCSSFEILTFEGLLMMLGEGQ